MKKHVHANIWFLYAGCNCARGTNSNVCSSQDTLKPQTQCLLLTTLALLQWTHSSPSWLLRVWSSDEKHQLHLRAALVTCRCVTIYPNIYQLKTTHMCCFCRSAFWAQLNYVLCFTVSHKAAIRVASQGLQCCLKAWLPPTLKTASLGTDRRSAEFFTCLGHPHVSG